MASRVAFLPFLTIFSFFVAVASNIEVDPLMPTAHSTGEPWPMPQNYKVTTDIFVLNRNTFEIRVTGTDSDLLRAAINRYNKIIFYAASATGVSKTTGNKFEPNGAMLTYLNVTVMRATHKDDYPALNMDESYNMKVTVAGAVLNANTVWGALRGLETFSQIVYRDEAGTFSIKGSAIVDFPRFSYRGVLLDTGRHFIPKQVLLANLEAMSYNKFNVFHWHIVDDQSFPYESREFPDLSAKGAYNPRNHVYTQTDIAEIIEFGRLRGIRVVPEFDTPGHTQSWGKGQPNLLTKCYKGGKPDGSFGPIDPTLNSTYAFLTSFFKEVTEVFPDAYIHLGGDEVNFSCWKSNPIIKSFMTKMKFGTDYSKLENLYIQRLLDIVNKLDHKYIVWQEIFDNKVQVRKDTVIHVWKNWHWQSEMENVTKAGVKGILSSPWYLNDIKTQADWKTYYAVNPTNFSGSSVQKKLVMGGEACLWGEFVDGTNLIPRFWPRASAVSERLWSAETVVDVASASTRIEEHRCRMLRRGIQAQPPYGPSFCDEPAPYYGPLF